MRRKLANKIVLITTLALLIFAGFSVLFYNYLNVKIIGERTLKMHSIYMQEIEELSSIEQLQEKVKLIPITARVTVATDMGTVLADNTLPISQVVNISSEEGFIAALNNKPKLVSVQSKSYNSTVLVYTSKVKTNYENYDYLILRVAVSLNHDSKYFIMMVPVLIIVVILVLLLTTTFTNTLIKNAISPLYFMQKRLEDINRGIYLQEEVECKYKDVQKVINEINSLGAKISNSVNYLDYEQKKSSFILDNMSQGIIALSKNANVVLTNSATLNFMGTTKNLLGCRLDTLIEDRQLLGKLNDAINFEQNIFFESELNDRVYRIEVFKVHDFLEKEDKGIATMITFTDITQESNSSKIRSEFFANASHELKTPLTAIKGYSELMQTTSPDKIPTKFVDEISKNANRMLSLIDDMLKLSKYDANVVDENADLLELREIADSVVSNLSSLAIDKNIKVSVKGKGRIYGNEKQIEEVITNLVDNAIKYNREDGKVQIDIFTKNKEVFCEIQDTGIGIDSSHQSRIFERFYRIDKGRNRKVNSTGLGLAIVKHIVMVHGGKIALESKLGVGSKFTLQFPLAE